MFLIFLISLIWVALTCGPIGWIIFLLVWILLSGGRQVIYVVQAPPAPEPPPKPKEFYEWFLDKNHRPIKLVRWPMT